MKLTPEQKAAFELADSVCGVVKQNRNGYVIRYPWRAGQANGPHTLSNGQYDYIRARQIRANYVAYYALRELGIDHGIAETLTYEKTGRAIDIFKSALQSPHL
jgi:hypothetical protein